MKDPTEEEARCAEQCANGMAADHEKLDVEIKPRKRIPPHLKYPHYLAANEEKLLNEKLTTSMVMDSMVKHTSSAMSMGRSKNQGRQYLRRPVPKIVKVFDLADNSLALVSNVSVDEPLFQPFPMHLQFQDYQPFKVYKKKLQFRNNDCVPRKIKIIQPSSQYFSVTAVEKKMDKIAAGMEASYIVTFRPHEKRDYHEKILCETERERFVVEVSALGPWTCVNFPDEVGFGLCPVNHTSSKTFLVRNVGEEKAQFSLAATPPFSVDPSAGTLDVNAAMQVTVHFSPKECVEYEGELEIVYGNSQKVYTYLHGTAQNVTIRLEEPVVELDATYITLISTKTVRILNTSDIPVNFKWVSFRDDEQDTGEKKRLLEDLNALEETEIKALDGKEYDLESVPQTESPEEARRLLYHADLEAISQKFNHLRTTLNEDSLIFSDENFSIDPKEGSIWAQSSIEITLTFKPLIAADFKSTAFLSVNGRDSRLPLQLFGRGLGPKAVFASTLIDTGEVYMGSIHRYQLQLENKGEIPCNYKLLPLPASCAGKVKIEPGEGELDVEDTQQLVITFCSQELGEVSEVFQFAMQGSSEVLKVKFQGSVIGPTFQFNVEEFCLGRVAYDFPLTHAFNIFNTSDIPMHYHLRIPGDGKFNECEFSLTPSSGTIAPHTCEDFLMQYLPKSRRRHEDLFLVVDIDGVGKAVQKVRIWAEGVVPNVNIMPKSNIEEDEESHMDDNQGSSLRLPFGECFLRHPYVQQILLQNKSDVHARYEIFEQEQASTSVAKHTPSARTGEIEPKGEAIVEVTLSCEKKGDVTVPLYVHIAGKESPPVTIDLVAHCVGPSLELSATSIDFGKVPCLENSSLELKLHNVSLINAPFQAFIKGDNSRFALNCYEGCLQPGEELDLTILVNPNDTTRHKDILQLCVQEGDTHTIPISAIGVGCTVRCSKLEELKQCAFGDVFTSRKVEKCYVVENKGKRPQLLTWQNLTVEETSQERGRLLKQVEQMSKHKDAAVRKKARRLPVPEVYTPGFVISPEAVLLQPRTACRFTVTACASKPGELLEKFTLSTKVGKEKKSSVVAEAEFSAAFIVPLLKASRKVVSFEHTFDGSRDADAAFDVMTQPLKLRNISTLPVSFTLRTQVPFSVDTWEVSLLPQQETELCVKFDPNLKEGLESYTIEGKLVAVYQHHPQRDTFLLTAAVNFPNLQLEIPKLDFGVVLNDTSSTKTFTLTNASKVAATYQWVFAEGHASTTADINDVFDISPLSGHLEPGELQQVEVSFSGHPDKLVKALALCQVQGGPSYRLDLAGACSDVSFEVSEQEVDVGEVLLGTSVEQAITITNTSKVPFTVSASVKAASATCPVSCSFSNRQVGAGQSATVRIHISPSVPQSIREVVHLHVAHFPKVPISVIGEGVVALASFSLPRENAEEFEAAKAKVLRRDPTLQQRIEEVTQQLEQWSDIAQPQVKKLRKTQEELQGTLCKEADLILLRRILGTGQDLAMNTIRLPAYTVDFGHVVHGTIRKQRFRLTNMGSVPVSMAIASSSKLGEVLALEPTHVDHLAPGGTADFKIQLCSKRLSQHHSFESLLQLHVQHGPSLFLNVLATVTVPAVQLSSRSIDLGTLMVGEARECCLQLTNVSDVPAQWSLLSSTDKQTGDVGCFEANPAAGQLRPGETCNTSLFFTPREGRPHNARLSLEVKQNPQVQLLACNAQVMEHKVEIEEHLLELGPVLPEGEGARKEFSLVNRSARAVEVFCVELDKQMWEEEEMIRAMERQIFQDGAAMARVPPRIPGDGLPAQIVQQYERISEEMQEDGVGEVEFAGHVEAQPSPRMAPMEIAPTCRERGLAVDVVIFGPPFSGQTTVCKGVAETLGGLPVFSLDDVLHQGALKGYIPAEICASLGLEAGEISSRSLRLEGVLKESEEGEEGLGVGLLARVLRNHLFETNCSRGIVIDGLASSILDKAGLSLKQRLEALLLAFTEPFRYPTIANSTLHAIPFDVNPDDLAGWLAGQHPEKGSDEERRLKDIRSSKQVDSFFEEQAEMMELLNASTASTIRARLAGPIEEITNELTPSGTPRQTGGGLSLYPMVTYDVLKRPVKRAPKRVVKEFALVTDEGEPMAASRWILAPGEEKHFIVAFSPEEVGEFEQQLTFEVVGSGQQCWTVARGLCAVPTMSTDPRNVFMNRVKAKVEGRLLQKRFIMASAEFEFGPLLAGNTDAEDPMHVEVLRISNSGPLPIEEISFSFKPMQSDEPGDEEVFSVDPPSLQIDSGETKEITVKASPMESRRFTAQLECSIKDNPNSECFIVTCEGTQPKLSIGGLTEKEEGGFEMVFDRLLLGREEAKAFRIVNESPLEVQWRMDTNELDQCADLTVSRTEGRLGFKESVEVVVAFRSKEIGSFAAKMPIVYSYAGRPASDSADPPSATETQIPISVSAEGYDITVQAVFGEGDENRLQVLDFGAIRVLDRLSKGFKLENRGMYETSFQFKMKRKRLEDVCKVEPMEGSLASGQSMDITVTLSAGREMQLQANKDLMCCIMEDIDHSKVFDTFTVPISFLSSFSRYKLNPPNAIAFGAVLYETTSEQTFEIHNDGEFEFSFAVLPEPIEASCAKEHALPADEVPNGVLRVGEEEVFTIEPQGGRILPKSSACIKASFSAKGHAHYRAVLHILISGRNMTESPSEHYTIPYELVAESCIPGINTSNFESIFEEQAVVRSLAAHTDSQGLFATEERCFSFGAMLPSGGAAANGACERFKLSNPNNVKAKVNLRIDPATPNCSAFQVQPASIELPPHEFQFVSVYFRPSAMQTYSASFIAEVENGTDDSTRLLEFELRGEGTLPCVTVIRPAAFTDEAKLLMDFGRLRTGRSMTKQVVVRNDGTVPATIRFDSAVHEAFQLPNRSSSCTIQPQQSHQFEMSFCPSSSGDHSTELLMRVLHNEYELTTILLKGEAYMEDVSINEDHICFGHLLLHDQQPASKTLEIVQRNHSAHCVRFEWPEHPLVDFVPKEGFIKAGNFMKIEATFTCDTPTRLTEESVEMTYVAVKQCGEEDQVEGVSVHKLAVRMSAIADVPKMEFSFDTSRGVNFKPTMMFQSRVYKFHMTNPSQVDIPFSWRFDARNPSRHGCPFSILPATGVLCAQAEETFTLRFSPKEVDDYAYVAHAEVEGVEGLDVDVDVRGRSNRPVCHFDLPASQYLERRGSGAALDGSTLVVEMESLGIRVKNSRRFYVRNPMSVSFNFKLEPFGEVNGRFNCLSKEGVIPAGKKYEVVLTFVPDDVQVQESLWQFSIPDHHINQKLLLVGRVIEPRVSLERRHINYHTVLVGGRHRETLALINEEHIPFSFSFDPSPATSDFATGKSVLNISPRSGTIPPNGKLMLCVEFAPVEEKAYNFNLTCRIHNKPGHLSLNVKGQGSAVHEKLLLCAEDTSGGQKEVQLSSKNSNRVDFGYVHVNDHVHREIVIRNDGTFNFDYSWTVPENMHRNAIALSPLKGVVACGEEVRCQFSFHPRMEMQLAEDAFCCTIAGDKLYKVLLSGQACKPSVSFSFLQFDFGPCFVAESGMSFPEEKTHLVISNNEPSSQVSIDCLFEKKGVFHVDCSPIVLQPGESKEVPISFSPSALCRFDEMIPFEINGLYTVNVCLMGQGVPLKLQLEDPEEQHLVCFGALKLNEEQTKTIGIVNCSMRAVDLEICETKPGAFAAQFLEVKPAGAVSLGPRERMSVSITYSPRVRRPSFSEMLQVGIYGWKMPMATITGACQAVDVKLDTETLLFGSVCCLCTVSKRVVLRNIGDLSSRFHFDGLASLAGNFTIFPTQGVIQPQTQTSIEVLYHPQAPQEDIRKVVHCRIEGMEREFQILTLAGACIAQPEEGIKTVEFQTSVREKTVKTVEVKNDSQEAWRIAPVVENEYWTAPSSLEIGAQSVAKIDIAYCPLTMTQGEEHRHQGTMFVALPNGMSMLFQLRGLASAPKEMPEIVETAVAKTHRHLEIPLENWLNEMQRFRVEIEKTCGSDTDFYDGSPTIDLPPMKSRKYKLRFIAYKAGESAVKLTFTNVATQEYLVYNVRVKCEAAEVQEIIAMEAPVRQSTTKSISIPNPFPEYESVVFATSPQDTTWWTCDHPQVRVREVENMSGKKNGVMEIDFRPLILMKEPAEATLVLKSERLGEYKYTLSLTSMQPAAERSLHFRSTLGTSSMQKFRFKHFLPSKGDFSCRVSQSLFFKVPEVLKLEAAESWEGSEACVTVEYEPQALGEVKDTLIISSDTGGRYECSLYGNCEPPRPQGPVKVSAKGAPIEFKNVFKEPKEYRFTTDSRCFIVDGARSSTKKIDGSKAATVTLKSVPGEIEGEESMGKLLVTCTDMPDLPAWTYYLCYEP